MRLGELCAGYGGLGMAVEEVFGAETAWFSEYDAAPSKILAHHWPGVPNYGDMTKIKWAPDCPTCGTRCAVYRHADDTPFYWCGLCSVEWDISIRHEDPEAELIPEPANIHSGGTPCQDLSAAGRRAGMTEGTRSNLWVQMREGIAIQRPKWVVWENVRGAYSATAASDLEQCPGCMGDTADGGAVLRALGRVLGDLSDLGYDCQWRGLRAADVGACHARFRVFVLAKNTNLATRGEWRISAPGQKEGGRTWPNPGRRSGAPATDARSEGLAVGGPGRIAPRQDAGAATVRNLAPTAWGEYEPAIRRWEAVMGRHSPAPTELSTRGFSRLSPRFTEWMMGLPDGWVTDPSIGISRNEQLKACGNGVVPQQAMAALRDMLAAFQTSEVAA